jgi:hypothetical protein
MPNDRMVYMLLRPPIPAWGRRYGPLAELALLGWCCRRPDGLLALTRAGPAVPPIFLPESDMGRMRWEVLITEALRQQLVATDQTGIVVRPVHKDHIIAMKWESWVLTATAPPEPLTIEDEGAYFREQPHSPTVAAQMGDLWELGMDEHAHWAGRNGITAWDGTDWFRVQDGHQDTDYIFVSERTKAWLTKTVPRWVTFRAFSLDSDITRRL